MKHRWASLISGGGTTMQAVANACLLGEIPLEVACVITNNPKAGGIQRAKDIGINEKDIIIIDPNEYKSDDIKVEQASFGQAILEELKKRDVTVITQNGWIPLTPTNVIEEYKDSIFNQHPGPLPDFGGKGMYGKRVHSAVLIYRRFTNTEPWTEALAHKVTQDFDGGDVVEYQRVDIDKEDTVESLFAKVKPIEHQLQVELLKDFISGNIKAEKRKPIVPKENQKVLELAKKISILLYPNG